jgi:predicted phosphodiesterase
MARVRALIVSDLHLGTGSGRDLARHPEALERLLGAIEGADQLILLGDVLELRDSPAPAVLERAEPILAEIARAAAGARVVLVAGNHDHQLAAEWLERRRLRRGAAPLGVEQIERAPRSGLAGRVARQFPGGEVVLAYPGLFVRPDVYATHGHYLDLHNTVPALEALVAQAAARVGGNGRSPHAPDGYESALAPVYALLYGLVQRAGTGAPRIARANVSMRVLERVRNPNGRLDLGHLLLTRVLLPAGVGAANLAGVGSFNADLSGPELRRAALRAMGEVVTRLAIDAAHVVFGHTHRRGPLPGDDPDEWRAPGGALLVNSGSWVHEPSLVASAGSESPYWPGSVVIVEDEGAPRLEPLLEHLPATAAVAERI